MSSAMNNHQKSCKALSLNIPSLITKELAITRKTNSDRRIRLSTNFLPLMGFTPGIRTEHKALGQGKGFSIKFNAEGQTKVYERKYTTRRNNPTEAIIDIQNQSLIRESIPSYTERLHFAMHRGEIIVTPLANRAFHIRKGVREADVRNAFVSMTSGVDCRSIEDNGFNIHSIIEYRPNEARDKTNMTETGAMNILANTNPTNMFNVDFMSADWRFIEDALGSDVITLLALSPQCDDFSVTKAKSLKGKSIDSLDTTKDMVFDVLRNIEVAQPGVVMIENVPGFKEYGDLISIRLRRWGYHVTQAVMEARDYGGLTSRRRYYLVASIFPGFAMPPPQTRRCTPVWELIQPFLEGCRDVSHTVSVRKGLETNRIRFVTSDDCHVPTILKSQNRQAKASVYIKTDDGRFLLPSENLLKFMSGIPDDFSLEAVGSSIASEIIGQSIDYAMHDGLIKAIASHVEINTCSSKTIVKNNNLWTTNQKQLALI